MSLSIHSDHSPKDSASQYALSRPRLGDLGAFSLEKNLQRLFCLVGTFVSHNDFFCSCTRVSTGFQSVMEKARLFHDSSDERLHLYSHFVKIPFFYSRGFERIVFRDGVDVMRVYRNKDKEHTLYTTYSNFDPRMHLFARKETQAIVLENDWEEVSTYRKSLEDRLAKINEELKRLYPATPERMRNLLFSCGRLRTTIQEIERATETVTAGQEKLMKLSEQRVMEIKALEDVRRYRALREQFPNGVQNEMERLLIEKRQISKEIEDLKKKCERFAKLRAELPYLMREKLCFFRDKNTDDTLELLERDFYPLGTSLNHRFGLKISLNEPLPSIPLSDTARKLLETRTSVLQEGAEDYREGEECIEVWNLLRSKLEDLDLALRDEDLSTESQYEVKPTQPKTDSSSSFGIEGKIRSCELNLSKIAAVLGERSPEGSYRFQVEKKLNEEEPFTILARLRNLSELIEREKQSLDRCLYQIGTISSSGEVQAYLTKRKQSLFKDQLVISVEIGELENRNWRIALEEGEHEGEFISLRIHLSSMRLKEIERWRSSNVMENMEISRLLRTWLLRTSNVPSEVKQYMTARQSDIQWELRLIDRETLRRMETLERHKKEASSKLQSMKSTRERLACELKELQTEFEEDPELQELISSALPSATDLLPKEESKENPGLPIPCNPGL